MIVFGVSEDSRNVDLGDETTTMICKFVVAQQNPKIPKYDDEEGNESDKEEGEDKKKEEEKYKDSEEDVENEPLTLSKLTTEEEVQNLSFQAPEWHMLCK
ncbi:hypothetical protein FNV43_RR00541 [Rhamnella rubrinervis]|uniref:Uncharacterized protein n=1 Tax=Rhamnella rubrinervis TaxID=2594499 RepID=A0A8K0MS16_9ROSA|nr:hypothetical protein FNV43_RR00541 [Rhamnella rubrinervis]